MSVKEAEEISEETPQQHETCAVRTLAAVSLFLSVTSLVISSVIAILVILSYFSPESDLNKIPDLCLLPPDPGPCTSSVNRRVRYLELLNDLNPRYDGLCSSGGITWPLLGTVSSSPGEDVTAMTTTLSALASAEKPAESRRRKVQRHTLCSWQHRHQYYHHHHHHQSLLQWQEHNPSTACCHLSQGLAVTEFRDFTLTLKAEVVWGIAINLYCSNTFDPLVKI